MASDPNATGAEADGSARLRLVAVAGSISVAAALIFVGWPEIDLAVSRLVYVEPRHFLLNGSGLGDALRLGFRILTWSAGMSAAAGIVLALARGRRLLDQSLASWVFLGLVLITGPGLLANTLLKDHWARPRPLYVVEFGGPDRFTPVLARSGQCARNCSFISGEASSIFALGFAVAMLARRRRAALMGAAVAAGALIGLIRIGEGGHFLSDVVFAGVFMALDVALMHWLMFGVLVPRARSETWWHAKTLAIAATIRHESELALAKAAAWLRQHRPASLAQRGKSEPEDPPA